MPSLYITNCTRQVHRFMYRTANAQHPIQIDLAGGEQKLISDKLSAEDIEKIITHHRAYGMVESNERPNAKAPLRYSIDKPMNFDRVATGVQQVDGALIDEGVARRAAAAVAISSQIEQNLFERQLPDRLQKVEVSTQEDSASPTFSEGIRVEADEQDREKSAHTRRNSPNKAK